MFDSRVKNRDPDTGKEMPVRRFIYTYDAQGNRSKPISIVLKPGRQGRGRLRRRSLRAREESLRRTAPQRPPLTSAHDLMISKRVIINGRVQGVGFRYTTKDLARGFDVCGSVRNLRRRQRRNPHRRRTRRGRRLPPRTRRGITGRPFHQGGEFEGDPATRRPPRLHHRTLTGERRHPAGRVVHPAQRICGGIAPSSAGLPYSSGTNFSATPLMQ